MTTKEKEERREKLAHLGVRLSNEINAAQINNGEEIDLLALLVGMSMYKAMAACGPDGAPKVLERFSQRLTIMHPSLKAYVVELPPQK